MADEVRGTAERSSRSSSANTVRIEEAGAVLAADATPYCNAALLIYLNERAFTDAGGVVAATVQRAIDAKLPIALVHEQDAERGACVFARYFDQAPDVLQQPPYTLFDRMAVPLYLGAAHREIRCAPRPTLPSRHRLCSTSLTSVPCHRAAYAT